ncbi:MAG: helix-turn-helix transcriptional regulator [Candidatus Thiodiazotropha sp. 6PLUC7]
MKNKKTNRLLQILASLMEDSPNPNGNTEIKSYGLIACANRVSIRHVPIDSPCILFILEGRKTMFNQGMEIVCDAGEVLTLPSPASFDLRNEPDPQTGRYRTLVLPFKQSDLESVHKIHEFSQPTSDRFPEILKFEHNDLLLRALQHYLSSDSEDYLLNHRLLELLLILAKEDSRLLNYSLSQESWSQKVRAFLATDLSKKWEISEICQRLAISESTLRRNLKNEQTGFRELLIEQRLSTALMLLLQTSLPITQIAFECGYQSASRFSNNFNKRFGLSPSEFRSNVNENEHDLTVSEHS